MPEDSTDPRLSELLDLVLEVAGGNYQARVSPSDEADAIDAVTVGMNLVAESLELERARRQRAEALLRDEVHAYEQAPAMFCSVDTSNFHIVKCNETLAKAIGLRKEALLDRRLLGLLPPDERATAEAALRAIDDERLPEATTFHLLTEDDRTIPILVSGSVTETDGRRRIRLILRDVSRERSLEAQLRQAQKLEAVGRLASGVAHDFNNILAVVLGSTALLQRILPRDHRGLRELAAISNAAENGSGLTRQLLALSKPIPQEQATSANLNDLIREAQPLLLRSLGPANELVFELSHDTLPVRVDPSELVQVLLNLTVNARDAMHSGGTLTIRTAQSVGEYDRPVVLLDVQDTGHGMDAALLDQVLEPFFTTKHESGGSGLGLAVCLRIVQQWRGALALTSEPDGGTRVRVSIPAVSANVATTPSGRASATDLGGKRILVVDDDPLVRDVLVYTLEEEGYKVLSADGLEEALERSRDIDDLFAVVTDVVMPGGSGVEVAKALWESQPDLGVVFVSGYTGSRVGASLLAQRNVRFIGKPFDHDELLDFVAEVGR